MPSLFLTLVIEKMVPYHCLRPRQNFWSKFWRCTNQRTGIKLKCQALYTRERWGEWRSNKPVNQSIRYLVRQNSTRLGSRLAMNLFWLMNTVSVFWIIGFFRYILNAPPDHTYYVPGNLKTLSWRTLPKHPCRKYISKWKTDIDEAKGNCSWQNLFKHSLQIKQGALIAVQPVTKVMLSTWIVRRIQVKRRWLSR